MSKVPSKSPVITKPPAQPALKPGTLPATGAKPGSLPATGAKPGTLPAQPGTLPAQPAAADAKPGATAPSAGLAGNSGQPNQIPGKSGTQVVNPGQPMIGGNVKPGAPGQIIS